MAEKFVTPAVLPTAHERELLTIFIEECAEAQQRATKLLRFGATEIQPGQDDSNSRRLALEIGDLLEMIDMLIKVGMVMQWDIVEGRWNKWKQLARYMQTEAGDG